MWGVGKKGEGILVQQFCFSTSEVCEREFKSLLVLLSEYKNDTLTMFTIALLTE